MFLGLLCSYFIRMATHYTHPVEHGVMITGRMLMV